MINNEVKEYMDNCVLCWLATSDADNTPNVSPKEIFTYQDDNTMVIGQIASPHSADNIRQNPKVCVSFVDIFLQKGFKLNGTAKLIPPDHKDFTRKKKLLTDRYSDQFPMESVIVVTINHVEPILAPSYIFDESATEEAQVESSLKAYKVRKDG